MRLTSPLNLPAPGRRQCVYGALCGLARTCVFAKQSLGPILCGLVARPEQVRLHHKASLLPKLRDHYAEFLDHVSLVHLRLLASPTCVGFRYGHPAAPPPAFLARRLNTSWIGRSLPSASPLRSFEAPYRLTRPLPQDRTCVVSVSLMVSTLQDGAGMSTGCPSATPLGPRLRVRLTLR